MSQGEDKYEEQRNELIKAADKSAINDRAQISVLKSRIIKFKDITTDGLEVSGNIRFIPLKLRVMGKVNYESSLYLSCNVIFEDLVGYRGPKSYGSEINGLNSYLSNRDNWINHISNLEFDKFVRLLGLNNYKLWINSITIND